MLKPKMIELTKEILNNLSIPNIIYTEISEPGAMGNEGGIMIYVIENQELICYETDWFDNKEIYLETGKLLLKHQNEYKNELLKIDEISDKDKLFFDYHYGGVGNHVFIKKYISLIQADDFFIHKVDNESYQINCSRIGVFNSVVYSMKDKKNQ